MRWPRDCSTNPDPLDILLNSLDLYLDFCFQNKILTYWQNTLRLIFQVSQNICHHPFKKFSFCHKLCFSNPFTFATRCRRPQIFQTMISVRLKNVSLKYQSCKDIGIRQFFATIYLFPFKSKIKKTIFSFFVNDSCTKYTLLDYKRRFN